ncbi:MAG: hypothetical protein ABI939_11515 [Anaerolineaceae bacterium]
MEEAKFPHKFDAGRTAAASAPHANHLGASVYEGVRVSHVDINAGPPSIKYNVAGKEMSTSCKIVVDASGRRTFLGNQLNLRIRDKVFDQFANAWTPLAQAAERSHRRRIQAGLLSARFSS